jgi:hypothetical protein
MQDLEAELATRLVDMQAASLEEVRSSQDPALLRSIEEQTRMVENE